MKHTLSSKPSLGQLQLVDIDGKVIEEYEIGTASFSIISHKNYFHLNFWVRAEYGYETPEGVRVSWGPTMEIFTKIPKVLDKFEVILPSVEEMYKAWDDDYRTGYYNGWHNVFEDAILNIEKVEDNLYKIGFSGVPDDDDQQAKVIGECTLERSKEMKRYW